MTPDPSLDFGGPLKRWAWSGLGGLEVPLRFPSLSCVVVVTTAATQRVAPLLPDARLQPLEIRPGRCLFVAGGLQYRGSDLGDYDEMALAVPVAFGGQRLLPVVDALRHGLSRLFEGFIWQMPVSTERARDGGLALAGFPKRVADLRFERDEHHLRCSLGEGGVPSLELAVQAGPQVGRRDLRLRAWTQQDGLLLKSTFWLQQTQWRDLLRPDGVALRLGQGPTAETLRLLELADRPLAVQACWQAQAVLFPPRNAMDD